MKSLMFIIGLSMSLCLGGYALAAHTSEWGQWFYGEKFRILIKAHGVNYAMTQDTLTKYLEKSVNIEDYYSGSSDSPKKKVLNVSVHSRHIMSAVKNTFGTFTAPLLIGIPILEIQLKHVNFDVVDGAKTVSFSCSLSVDDGELGITNCDSSPSGYEWRDRDDIPLGEIAEFLPSYN